MITLCLIAERQGRHDWYDLIRKWAENLLNNLPRVNNCGFQHVVKERPNDGQLWDDTLFMTGLFLAKAGDILKLNSLIHEAELQFISHAQYLADNVTGLWYHGWTEIEKHHFAAAFWARGNSWITVAIPELIELISNKLNPAIKLHLTALLEKQIDSLIELQADNGMWHTLLDDPESPQESSAVAGIAYGLLKSCRFNILPKEKQTIVKESATLAINAVMKRIDDKGILLEASDGTAMGHDLQYYHDIQNTPVPYGQALAMMALIEFIQQN